MLEDRPEALGAGVVEAAAVAPMERIQIDGLAELGEALRSENWADSTDRRNTPIMEV